MSIKVLYQQERPLGNWLEVFRFDLSGKAINLPRAKDLAQQTRQVNNRKVSWLQLKISYAMNWSEVKFKNHNLQDFNLGVEKVRYI